MTNDYEYIFGYYIHTYIQIGINDSQLVSDRDNRLAFYIISSHEHVIIHDHQEDTDVKCYLKRVYISKIA